MSASLLDDPEVQAALAQVFVGAGMLKANDKPEDYYGSVEHQHELFAKVGMPFSEWDADNPETVRRFYGLCVNAQINGRDKDGNPLSLGDMRILSAITGMS